MNAHLNQISVTTIFSAMLFRAIRWGILLGVVCGAVAGLPVFGLGALFGMFIGPIVGVLSGVGSVMILTPITIWRYNPLHVEHHLEYRIVASLVCVTIALGVTLRIFYSITHFDTDILQYVIIFVILPTVLAAIRSSYGLTSWYIECNGQQRANEPVL